MSLRIGNADSIRKHLPQAKLVFDRFHLVRHCLDALDEVRREEVRQLSGSGKQAIKGTRFILLKNPWNPTSGERDCLFALATSAKANRRLLRGYLLKESFQLFWGFGAIAAFFGPNDSSKTGSGKRRTAAWSP